MLGIREADRDVRGHVLRSSVAFIELETMLRAHGVDSASKTSTGRPTATLLFIVRKENICTVALEAANGNEHSIIGGLPERVH